MKREGSIVLRSRTEIEEMKNGRERIVVTEFNMVIRPRSMSILFVWCRKNDDGITAVRMSPTVKVSRFVIEVRRDASAHVILNNLFKLTQMQTNFSFNMLAIQMVCQRFCLCVRFCSLH